MGDRFRKAFDDIERVDSLVDSFPIRVFKSKIPNIPGITGIRTKMIRDRNGYKHDSHVNERIVKELSICNRDIAMFFFPQELFLASPDVRNNGIEVVVRVPE